MSICTTNYIANISIKNQLLADAIPAETYAAGRNPVPNLVNVEMQSQKTGGGDWTHSFLIEAPYAWTYLIFNHIKDRSK